MLVRNRRGSYEALKDHKGLPGTLTVDTTHNRLVLFDGEREGGYYVGSDILLQGPTKVVAGIPNVFTIVNHDVFSVYTASSSAGTVTVVGSEIIIELTVDVLDLVLTVGKEGGGSRTLVLSGGMDTGPGPTQLIGGNLTAGFFGETSANALITGLNLASLIGLTAGTSQYSSEPWLKFALDGRILFVAKKPMRHSIQWNHLNAVNAVYGREGDAEVVRGGRRYRVRLLKGADRDPTNVSAATFNPVGTRLSEWSRLMYPIHSGIHTDGRNPALSEMGTWASYSDEDLLVFQSYGNGSQSWCQETRSSGRVIRGALGITYFNSVVSSASGTHNGWRPVLELIP